MRDDGRSVTPESGSAAHSLRFAVRFERIVVEARCSNIATGAQRQMNEDVREGRHDRSHNRTHVINKAFMERGLISSSSPDPLDILQQVTVARVESNRHLQQKQSSEYTM